MPWSIQQIVCLMIALNILQVKTKLSRQFCFEEVLVVIFAVFLLVLLQLVVEVVAKPLMRL